MSRPLKRLINPELAVIICIGGLRPWIVLVPSLVAEEVFLGHSKRTILIKSKWWAMAQLWLCPPFIWLHRMTELYKYCCVYRSQCLICEVSIRECRGSSLLRGGLLRLFQADQPHRQQMTCRDALFVTLYLCLVTESHGQPIGCRIWQVSCILHGMAKLYE